MGKYMQDPRLLKTLEVALGLKVATGEDATEPTSGHPGGDVVGDAAGVNGHVGGVGAGGDHDAPMQEVAQETSTPMEVGVVDLCGVSEGWGVHSACHDV